MIVREPTGPTSDQSGEDLIPTPNNEGIQPSKIENSQAGFKGEESNDLEIEQEEKFDYKTEVAKVEARYQERMRKWQYILAEAFGGNDRAYQDWSRSSGIYKENFPEKNLLIAQALKKKESEIMEEKSMAILDLDKKRDVIRIKKIEEI